MFLCILFEPKTNHRFEITSSFFFPCYVQYPIDYSHGHMNFSHHHFLISYSPATFNMFHVTREVTLSARKSITSKNNFRGITMGIRPIWGITSLTFILSCMKSLSLLSKFPRSSWTTLSFSNLGTFRQVRHSSLLFTARVRVEHCWSILPSKTQFHRKYNALQLFSRFPSRLMIT